MKNKTLLICGFLLLIIFIGVGTYTWYLYFVKISANIPIGPNNNPYIDGSIVLKDNGNSIIDSEANKIDDEKINQVIPYKFQIINNGQDREYTLYLEDLALNVIDDGCTAETLLTRNQLKYQLKLNDEVIKEDFLSNINNNILDKREIASNSENDYELRIYIHDEAEDWEEKHYHYRVVLSKIN